MNFVKTVHLGTHVSEIFYAIVLLVSIYVIYVSPRPLTFLYKPYHVADLNPLPKERHLKISAGCLSSSDGSGTNCASSNSPPY